MLQPDLEPLQRNLPRVQQPRPSGPPPPKEKVEKKGQLPAALMILQPAVLTTTSPPVFSQEVEDIFQEHWQYYEQLTSAKAKGLHQVFKDWTIKAKATHKTLVSKIGLANVLARTEDWNPGEWNWNTMEKFPPRRKRAREEGQPRVARPTPGPSRPGPSRGVSLGTHIGRMTDLLVQVKDEMDAHVASALNQAPKRAKRARKQ